jgi:hypothetical protein
MNSCLSSASFSTGKKYQNHPFLFKEVWKFGEQFYSGERPWLTNGFFGGLRLASLSFCFRPLHGSTAPKSVWPGLSSTRSARRIEKRREDRSGDFAEGCSLVPPGRLPDSTQN